MLSDKQNWTKKRKRRRICPSVFTLDAISGFPRAVPTPIATCQQGKCTDVKDEENNQKQFLGGCDLREEMNGPKLKSIDDFNASAAAGGSEGAPVLERLRSVLGELGVENELFDQVLEGVKKEEMTKNGLQEDDAKVVDEATKTLGLKLK
eukprot:scaffold39844_cov139-Skeletonema_marinoi.AAC.1